MATSSPTYSPSNNQRLTVATNIANVQVGSLVEGVGVGHEVYVRSKNVAAQEINSSSAPFDADGTQTFTFRKFRYLFDFSGYTQLSKFSISEVKL